MGCGKGGYGGKAGGKGFVRVKGKGLIVGFEKESVTIVRERF